MAAGCTERETHESVLTSQRITKCDNLPSYPDVPSGEITDSFVSFLTWLYITGFYDAFRIHVWGHASDAHIDLASLKTERFNSKPEVRKIIQPIKVKGKTCNLKMSYNKRYSCSNTVLFIYLRTRKLTRP